MKKALSLFLSLLLLFGLVGCAKPAAVQPENIMEDDFKVFTSSDATLLLGSDGRLWGRGESINGGIVGGAVVRGYEPLTERQRAELPTEIAQYLTEDNDITGVLNLRLLAENVVDFSFNSYLLILCADGKLYDYRGMRFSGSIALEGVEDLVPLYENVTDLCDDSNYSFMLGDGTVISTQWQRYDTENYEDCEGLSGQKMSKFKHKAKKVFDAAYIDLENNLWIHGYNSYGWLGNGKQDPIKLTEYADGQILPDGFYTYHKVLEDVADFASVRDVLCAALKTDGSLWTWGANEYGTVGNGKHGDGYFDTCECVSEPYRVLENVEEMLISRRINGVSDRIVEQTMIARTSDGSVYCWGANGEGLVGNGKVAARSEEVTLGCVDRPYRVLTGIKDICRIFSYRGGTFLALSDSGELFGWGNSVCGEVGSGVKQIGHNVVAADDPSFCVGTPTNIADQVIFAGGYMSPMLIRADGSVWVWGMNPLSLSHTTKTREEEASDPTVGVNMVILPSPVKSPQISAIIGEDGSVSFVPAPVE